MKYFVTGATGFIGTPLVRQLRAAGHNVVALVRNPAAASDLAKIGVVVYNGDITRRASLREAMEGADGVFHLAGWYRVGVRDGTLGAQVNVEGTRNVLETMRDLGIPRGVYTSTVAVHGNTHGRVVDETWRYTGPHVSWYEKTKWQAHYEVAEPMMRAGLPLVVVLPALVYGVGDPSAVGEALREYLQRKLPMIATGTAFSWTHIDDLVDGLLMAMDRGHVGECYHLAGEARSLVEVMALAERLTGVRAPSLHLPPFALKLLAAIMEQVERVAKVPMRYTSEYLRVNAGVTYLADSSKAHRELGWQPRTLEAGLRKTLAEEMHRLRILR